MTEANKSELGSGAMDSFIEHSIEVCTGPMRNALLHSHTENLALRKLTIGGDVGRDALLKTIDNNSSVYAAAVSGLQEVNQVLLDRIKVLEKKAGKKKK